MQGLMPGHCGGQVEKSGEGNQAVRCLAQKAPIPSAFVYVYVAQPGTLLLLNVRAHLPARGTQAKTGSRGGRRLPESQETQWRPAPSHEDQVMPPTILKYDLAGTVNTGAARC